MAKKLNEKTTKTLKERRKLPLATPTDLAAAATRDISAALNQLLADVFAL
ncbi:DNA starvation/stationary phase protection protein, partial [Escherichia coli]|nr:DNA starvation/stationary phase protection protein [Escherichia coli]